MNAITTSSTPAPPSYNDSAHARVNEHLPTSELLSLQIGGDPVFDRASNAILYRLTQASSSGTGSVLGVEEMVYKPSPPGSEEPRVNTRMRHLYDVKDIKWFAFAQLEQGEYGIEPQSGSTHCFSRGACLLKGKRVPLFYSFFGRMGSTWRVLTAQNDLVVSLRGKKISDTVRLWRDNKGNIIAVESGRDGCFVLELKIHLEKRMLNLLVTAWCAIIWHVNRVRRGLEVLKAHKNFGKWYRLYLTICS